MLKWTKVDQRTGEPAKRNCNSFEPHDYVSDDERLDMKIINHSFVRRKGAWELVTKKGTQLAVFDTLKAAKAYAETLNAELNKQQKQG